MHHLQRPAFSGESGTRQATGRVRQVFVPAEAAPLSHIPQGKKRDLRTQGPANRIAAAPDPEKPEVDIRTQAIPKQELVRGFEYEKDKYVAFESAELEKLGAPANSSTMEIIEFVRFAEVDPVYLESSYYVTPDKGGEKPYALLFESLGKTGYSAIAEFVMHRRDQTILLRPGRHGIIAHTLFHADEVKRENEFHADPALVKPGEAELAIKLVEALSAAYEPEKFKDKYRERLNAAIAEKLQTGAVTEAASAPVHAAPVIDIVAALKQSLAQSRKPAVREIRSDGPGRNKRATGG